MTDWQPKETAPKDGSFVLTTNVVGEHYERYRVAHWHDDRWCDPVTGMRYIFTHWAKITPPNGTVAL